MRPAAAAASKTKTLAALGLAGFFLAFMGVPAVMAQPGAGKIIRPIPGKKMPRLPGAGIDDKQARRISEIERFDRMTPDQRRRALDRLPPERRQRIENGLAQYRAMNPANRERLRNFENLPQEQRDNIRQSFRRMQELPAPRRVMMRRELQQLRGLSPEERETRLQSEGFRRRFDDTEQGIIRDTVANFPIQPE